MRHDAEYSRPQRSPDRCAARCRETIVGKAGEGKKPFTPREVVFDTEGIGQKTWGKTWERIELDPARVEDDSFF
jgi:hypothetical protein